MVEGDIQATKPYNDLEYVPCADDTECSEGYYCSFGYCEVSEPNETLSSAPLLMRHEPTPSAGRVLYTTFHNHAQLSEDVEKILQHVIFSL
mgnify:CR=1 FL=1